jgi:hypothetical protein
MTPIRRQIISLGIVALMLGIAATMSINWMAKQRDMALSEAENLGECRTVARQIESLRTRPTVASAEDMEIQELGQRIENAFRQTGMSADSLEGVFPQSARRVGDTPYLRKPTALVLRGVNLGQFAGFLYHLSDGSGLTVRDLRLRTPHGSNRDELWDAEATLTYLIYSPAARSRPGQ